MTNESDGYEGDGKGMAAMQLPGLATTKMLI